MNPHPGRLRRVICVCEERDVDVWAAVSRSLPGCMDAADYQLICPDAQVEAFRKATSPIWNIVPESRYDGGYGLEQIRSRVKGANLARTNWLFQQFLKIHAVVDPDLADEDVVLIWDADTLPLRRIEFIAERGELLYYHAREHHHPYFDTLRRLCGCERLAEVSFIAQCLPVRSGRVRELIQEMVGVSSAPFVETVLAALPGESGSEFSEYETIGNWMLLRHPDEVILRRRNCWLRSGASLLGRRRNGWRMRLLPWLLGFRYDFVAIEKWRRPVSVRRLVNFVSRRFGRGA